MKNILKLFTISIISLVSLFIVLGSVNTVHARGSASGSTSTDESVICTIFPFLNDIPAVNDSICNPGQEGGEKAVSDVVAFARLGLSLIFIGIILIAVYVIIKAAVKYIRSEGNEDKIQEAQKAIKQVFVGIGALFVGLIGLVIIIVFFNATGALNDTETVDTDNPIIDPLL